MGSRIPLSELVAQLARLVSDLAEAVDDLQGGAGTPTKRSLHSRLQDISGAAEGLHDFIRDMQA